MKLMTDKNLIQLIEIFEVSARSITDSIFVDIYILNVLSKVFHK